MKELLIATHNNAKLADLRVYLASLSVEIVSLSDLSIVDEVKEDGKTYEENAEKKALSYAKMSGLPTLSDDAGFEIDALGGLPGVESRYWGSDKGDDESIIKKLEDTASTIGDANRAARFVVVVSFALPSGEVWSVRESTQGIIAKTPYSKVVRGYPYRPYFFIPEINKYYIEEELTEEEKKQYNHRYKAIQRIQPIIQKAFVQKLLK